MKSGLAGLFRELRRGGRERMLTATVATVLLFSGCTRVGPDYVRPEVMVAPKWMESRDERVKDTAVDYRNWWHAFGDPALDRLIDRAYRENLSLRIAGVRVLEARAQLGIATGELYPQTQQATGSLQYNRTSERAAQSFPGQQFSYLQSQIGITAVWEMDFWGKFRRGIESAGASWHATIADYDNAMVSLTADVANSYISIRVLEKRIGIASQNAETQQEGLKIAEARYRYGTTTQLDLEQARTVLNNTLATIPSLKAQLRQAQNALSVLIGTTPDELSDYLGGESAIPVCPNDVVAGIPADLLRRRPDIRSAEYRAAAQSAQIGVAKADLYPAFSLNGTFGFLSSNAGNSSLGDMFQWKSRNIQAGPSFQWSVLNYGRITNNVRLQDARLQELLIVYQNTVLAAQQEVEDNLASFLRSQERSAFLSISAESARKAFDTAVRQYREGIKDFTAVLLAEQSLLNEQDNLAVTLGDISHGLVGVYRALGGGWEVGEGENLVPPAVKEEMKKRTDWGGLLSPSSYNPPEEKNVKRER